MAPKSLKTANSKQKTEHSSARPRALVLYGYGLNCDYETAFALNQAGAEAHRVHTTELLENPTAIWNYHLLAVPGGFSWGDEHGAGVILALRLKLALGSALQEFIEAGRLVIGICNGFQVLVNLGLLPGLEGRPGERLAALIPNDCGNFRDAWVHLKVEPSRCIFTKGLDQLELPIRHGEGKFFAAPEVLAEIKDKGQIALKYATAAGAEAAGRFPDNPNGSLLDIAGVTDASGLVLGLMPHPEAHVTSFQHPTWTREKEAWRRRNQPYPEQEGAGLAVFKNAIKYMEGIL